MSRFDLSSCPFIHLRVHTPYSLLQSACRIEVIKERITSFKMPACAITDSHNLFGIMEFTKELTKEGIQPIIGCDLHIHAESSLQNVSTGKIQGSLPSESFLCLVQNEEGYRNLLHLMALSYDNERCAKEKPHIRLDDLTPERCQGLLLLLGGIEGTLGRLIEEKNDSAIGSYLEKIRRFFPQRHYMELSRLGYAKEQALEPEFIRIAYEHDIPLVATNKVLFRDSGTHKAHDVLHCIAEGLYVSQEDRKRFSPEHGFKSSQEMAVLFENLPEAYLNTLQVARRCAFYPEDKKVLFPKFDKESSLSEDMQLKELSRVGLTKRLEGNERCGSASVRAEYEKRLAYELDVILTMGYASYFLIVADFIQWAKNHKIPVGPGRGSGAGSLVAWALTITDMDPIEQGLFFERFLNPERVSMPDFDIDFCQERREEVISYVQQRYGKDHVAQIITFGKLQARAVIRDVGRVLGMPYTQVDKISKLIPQNPANPVSLKEALVQEKELQEMQTQDPSVATLLELALELEGLYRHASTHAAGIVIGDRPLQELVPLYKDPRSHMWVTQFNMKFVENAGLIKFDFLGLKTLTVIEEACKSIQKILPEFDIGKIPLDDKDTYALLNRVETHGIFQLESAGMKDVVAKLQPDHFGELVALIALYRPGPMDDIPRFIACKHGHEPVTYLHPLLEPILKDTYGVMVYQEQVMQIAQQLADFTMGGADLLRRAMGKKIKAEMDAQRVLFIAGAKGKGIKEGVAEEIFSQMAKFASYGFPKAHAAPYALLLYQTAYLKAHYPVYFLSALMSLDHGNTDKVCETVMEAKRLGISIDPPDINQSEVSFMPVIEGHKPVRIRYALSALKGVGAASMEEVVAERKKNGLYESVGDFAQRHTTKVIHRRQLESLIAAGVFDSLHGNRASLYASCDSFIKAAAPLDRRTTSQQPSLFDANVLAVKKATFHLTETPEWPWLQKLQKEFEAVGFYLTAHPLQGITKELLKRGYIGLSELAKSQGVSSLVSKKVAGVVTRVQKKLSRSGAAYAFIQLSDPSGIMEITLFSSLLTRVRDFLEEGMIVGVDLLIKNDGDGVRYIGQDLHLLDALYEEANAITPVEIGDLESWNRFVRQIEPYRGKGRAKVQVRIPIKFPPELAPTGLWAQVLVSLGDVFELPPDHDLLFPQENAFKGAGMGLVS